jgi:hypothetical protein
MQATFGVAVDNSCALHTPALSGEACESFDALDGDVYLTGAYGGHVNRFSASGKLLSSFGGIFDGAAAVDPMNGDVYVLNTVRNETTETFEPFVETYDPATGAQVGTPFPVTPSSNFDGLVTVVQIATDSFGDVYVPVIPANEVIEYSPTGTPLHTFTGSGTSALKGPTGVAVDSSGNVWVADYGDNRIEEFKPSGAVVSANEIKSKGVESVAVDANDNVFAILDNSEDSCGSFAQPCPHLVEYAAGKRVADIGAGDMPMPSVAGGVVMLAVSDETGRVYLAEPSGEEAQELVWVYGPPAAPVLGRELATEVGSTEAKLGALVNPGGIGTSYRFEYDTREYQEGEGPHGVSVPFPEGSAGEGLSSHTVWASASDLQPGVTYDYRVLVSNALGTEYGPDQTFTTETSAETSCPNEQLRTGFSGSLPDCRAYELVTPPNDASTQPDTEGLSPIPTGGGVEQNYAASDGNRMSYFSVEVLPGSQSGGYDYVATRGASGWSSENVIPRQSYTSDRCPDADSAMDAYSADLSEGVLFVGGDENGSEKKREPNGGCGAEGVQVVSGEPLGVENLLLRDNTDGAYQLINPAPPGVTPTDAQFIGASADLSHVVFREQAKLTANALGNPERVIENGTEPRSGNLYEWSEGVLRLVTVLPDGAPVAGSFAGISAEGSDVLFTAGGGLYARVDGTRTVQLDASQTGGSGGGVFDDVSADGSQVFFTDESRLTSDSTAQAGKPDLYEYDVQAPEGERLTDLSADPGEPADVRSVSGISNDGSYVYFAAEGVLASNENANKEKATAGQGNLYLDENGATKFIATTEGGSVEDPRVSPNGNYLAFPSQKSLTGYDNVSAEGPVAEIFLYDAAANQLACASCNPSGEVPSGGQGQEGGAEIKRDEAGSPHYLSDSGQVFFQTRSVLLPRDTSGQTEVYEYAHGQLHLISSGTSRTGSTFLDASESGDDVFFLTRQALVPQQTDEEALGIYDARVDGGFPEPSVPPPCTTADACRAASAPAPSIFGAPASQTFSGVGNLTPPAPTVKKVTKKVAKCAKGKARNKHGKCVKQKTSKKTKAKRANRNRRPSR